MTLKQGTHVSKGRAVDLSQIMAVEWKHFELHDEHFVFHIPTASLIAIPAKVGEAFKASGESIASAIPELKALSESSKVAPTTQPPREFLGIALNVAEVCNLRCTYCYAGDGNYGADTLMSWETAERVLNFFAAQTDRLHIVFFGGEPLLNFDLIKRVVEWCEQTTGKIYTFSMTTNGTLLNTERLQWLTSKRFSLNISWDGHGIHAQQRPVKGSKGTNGAMTADSEATVLRRLTQLQDQLLSLKGFQLRGTVQETNLSMMEEAIVRTLNELPHAYMIASATQATGFHEAETAIHEAHAIVQRVVRRLLDERKYDQLKRLRTIWQFVAKLHRQEKRTMTCGAGINYFSVSTTGNFYLCHRFTEDKTAHLGSIDTGFCSEKLAKIAEHRLAHHDPCKQCWMRETCAGGCFHDNKVANNTEFFADPKFCLNQHLLFTLAIEVYTELLRSAPEVLDRQPVNWRTETV